MHRVLKNKAKVNMFAGSSDLNILHVQSTSAERKHGTVELAAQVSPVGTNAAPTFQRINDSTALQGALQMLTVNVDLSLGVGCSLSVNEKKQLI